MSIDKNRIKKFIGISVVAIGAAFVGMSILAKKKNPSSVYEEDKEQKNPFEGKKVVLIEDENDKENADGVKGHLEAIGDSEYNPSFYEKHVKRAIDVVLSFGGLVVLSPVSLLSLWPLRSKIRVRCYSHRSGWVRTRDILNYINSVL